MAGELGCKPGEVVFTSGGSEADNQALRTAAAWGQAHGRTRIVSSQIEHPAILNTLSELMIEGFSVTLLAPSAEGVMSVEDIAQAMGPDVCALSLMAVNNEVGTVQPFEEAARLAHEAGALFHTDAVQGAGHVAIDIEAIGIDMLSVSAHKFHGPKGVGLLVCRNQAFGEPLAPVSLILGGGQENGLRSGTEPTAQIAAFARACELGLARRDADIAHMQELKGYTLRRIAEEVPQVVPVIEGEAPHVLALTMTGYKSEVLVRVLGDRGVCVSAGSACHRGKPSHVYAAMNLTKPQRDGAFRVSFSGDSTKEEVDALIDGLKFAAETLFPSMS